MGDGGRVVIEREHGLARVGSLVVEVAEAGSSGEMRVGTVDGPILRPLSFGERSRVVHRTGTAAEPRASLGTGILRAATVAPGTTAAVEPIVLEILALELAGAGLAEAPAFAETQVEVARATGWSYDELAAIEAAEVDRLAISLAGTDMGADGEDGWQRLVLASDLANDLSGLRADLADTLLLRARPPSASAARQRRGTSPADRFGPPLPRPHPDLDVAGEPLPSLVERAVSQSGPDLSGPLIAASVDLALVHRWSRPSPTGSVPKGGNGAAGQRLGGPHRRATFGPVALGAPSRSPVPATTTDHGGASTETRPLLNADPPSPIAGADDWLDATWPPPAMGLAQSGLATATSPARQQWSVPTGWDEQPRRGSDPRMNPVPSLAAPSGSPLPALGPRLESSIEEIADLLAALLHDEADLRGLDR